MTISAQASRAPEPETTAHLVSDQGRPEGDLLSGLLEAQARLAPDRVLLCEPAISMPRLWSAAALQDGALALAAHFARLRLSPGALIGLCLPGGGAFLVSLLAAERAGLTPVLLPLTGNWPALARQIEETGIQAVVTTAQLDGERPAERLSEIAARYFRLRFVMAFGPEVPDGVADLDHVLARPAAAFPSHSIADDGALPGLVTLTGGAAGHPVFRPWRALVAASAAILDSARIQAGERIVTLLAPDDLAGLATGPLPALLTGASLEAHAVFDGRTLLASLAIARATHLVAPGWMEPLLGRLGLPEELGSVILVHRAPTRFSARTALARRVVDVLAFGELALLAAPRRPGGLPSLSLEAWPESAVSDMLQCNLDQSGKVSFAGPAACCGALEGRQLPQPGTLGGWHVSNFRPELFAGLVVGVS